MLIDVELFDEVKKMTGNCYNFYPTKDEEKILVDVENIMCMLADMICDAKEWKNKYWELQRDVEENYTPIPYEKQIDYSEKDFYKD